MVLQQPLSWCRVRQILSAILLSLIFCAASAMAQAPEKTSSSENVAIAFFKTGNVQPDYTRWAMKAVKHSMVQKTREKEYLEKETGRLSALWNAYDPAKDMLSVKTKVDVKLATEVTKAGDVSHSMTISFQKGAADYFPFKFQDYMIALVPQKLGETLIQPLSLEQFNLIHASFEGSSGQGILYLSLKPVKADMTRPYEMDNHEQWMFVTDIAGMSLQDHNGSPLWDYSAPWYVTPTTADVQQMFTRHKDEEKAEDAAEGIIP
jgi:hypothetical protein